MWDWVGPRTNLDDLENKYYKCCWWCWLCCYLGMYIHYPLLGAFTKFRKATTCVCPSFRLSAWNKSAHIGRICMKPDGWAFFRKCVEKIQVTLKSDRNNGYFTCRPMYICSSISLNFLKMRSIWHKSDREVENTHLCLITLFFENRDVYEIMRKMWWSQRDHRWQHNTAHALCKLDN
jgi:hypothetical protein